ncbi:hypothetical protein LCGC14_1137440 [marine sediment metagenome]|uniref:Uncharacterized protein n=1 Tax=marine sediment metagenome TaxID=412755 RepID=A0A0F9MM99_9ZZZZ
MQRGLNDEPTFITESLRTIAAHWKVGTNDADEIITIVETRPSQAILLTDIIITSSKKVANSTVVVRFYDGTNMEIEGVSAPVEFSHSFVGGVKGWKDANFQVVTNQAAMLVRTFVGYIKRINVRIQ